jgi:spermidine/putrescine transport system permease protein
MRLAEIDSGLEEAAWNLGANEWRAVREVILPFVAPALLASLLVTMAVSFDEFMIAWFVSGLDQTLPVKILLLLQGQVSPRINAIGTIVFLISFSLVAFAQGLIFVTGRKGVRGGEVK